ncbi:transmembrane protein 205 [Indicator indicator]|uniref:transmembrane protein 205 n=1 Tax=Indicator indicator TaxID=1002788 RepID=UPI0023DFD407|nr:transmembrane protein 205 [Indicator indicator]
MVRDAEASTTIKLLHLLCLSTSWLVGCSLWLSPPAGFVMSSHLPRCTFSFIQLKLFPYYFHISSACAFFSLALFTMHHPSELLSNEQQTQLVLFVCVAASVLNTQWFRRVTSDTVAAMHLMELTHSLGPATHQSCQQLPASNPTYKQLSQELTFYHALSSLCNFCCIVCNGLNLYYLAAALPAL